MSRVMEQLHARYNSLEGTELDCAAMNEIERLQKQVNKLQRVLERHLDDIRESLREIR